MSASARYVLPLLVFSVAFAARLGMVYARGGSLHDSPSYDTSVYYAAADALVHGRIPYRDFTLLHPPGLMLALTPFATIGRLTSDHVGFMIGCVAWMALGATNAVLVYAISRRMRMGTHAAVVGGLGYALWYEASRSEYALRLEPLGNLFVLLGVLAFVRSGRSGSRIASVGCGAALGAAASVKIWYVVPMVVVLGWHSIDRRTHRQLGWAALGAATTIVAINVPFLVLAGTRMPMMVIVDQLSRNSAGGNPIKRLAQLASSGQIGRTSMSASVIAVTLLGGVVFAGLCAAAWRRREARMVVALAVLQLIVVAAAPSFFPYYSDYLAPATSLTAAAAAATLLNHAAARRSRVRRRLLAGAGWLPIVVVGTMAVAIDLFHPLHAVTPAPDGWLQRAAASARCVQANTPMALIQLNALSRDLADNCQVWVDVTGRSYAPPLKPTGRIHGKRVVRATFRPWQRAMERYLLAGDCSIVIQPAQTGLSRRTLSTVDRRAIVGRADGYVLHCRNSGHERMRSRALMIPATK